MSRGWTSGAALSVLLAVLGAGVRAEPSGDGRRACGSNVRLVDSRQRFAVERALRVAIGWLRDPACLALLDEFQDHSGRPLRDCLETLGLSAPDLASRVLFYDAPPAACRPAILALACPGSRVVYVCGARFVRQMKCDSRHAQAVLIHELLHAAGLGENPPTSHDITARIRECCGQGGATPRTELAHR